MSGGGRRLAMAICGGYEADTVQPCHSTACCDSAWLPFTLAQVGGLKERLPGLELDSMPRSNQQRVQQVWRAVSE